MNAPIGQYYQHYYRYLYSALIMGTFTTSINIDVQNKTNIQIISRILTFKLLHILFGFVNLKIKLIIIYNTRVTIKKDELRCKG